MLTEETLPSYVIVGGGKMAAHSARYLELLNVPFRQWTRKNETPLKEVVDPQDIVLLLITDDAIEPFLDGHPWLETNTVVHFSGSLTSKRAVGAHPLCTFGPDLYDLATYQHIPFIYDADGPTFRELFPSLPNPQFPLAAKDKAIYHAVSVMAGNFSTLLWNKLFDTFTNHLHLPPQAALPYLEQVCHNIRMNPGGDSTGPLARNDRATIERNIEALGQDPFAEVYRAMARAISAQHTDGQP